MHLVTHKFIGDEELCRKELQNGKLCYLPIESHQIPKPPTWIGIDGEGQGRLDHKYVFMAASTEDRTHQWSIKRNSGIRTHEALEFILSISAKQIYAYGFNYDLTKILDDIDNETLYKLFRPGLRKGKYGPKPVQWHDFKLNLQGSKFTIRHEDKKVIVWDIIKFFQCTFVNALKEWKVGDPKVLENMQYMKDHRNEFDKLPSEKVEAYCLDECAYMAALANKLYTAHEKAGLKLRNFYGAGSSASAMLKNMGIKEQIVPCPEEMKFAVASAYFGGRFECSITGEISGPLYNYDISSAYPYQTYFLPCLVHGKWELVKDEKILHWKNTTHALVKYRLDTYPNTSIKSWAPFPFRDPEGNICYPITSGGGWLWRDEYLAGQKLFANVIFEQAWILRTTCKCHPFKEVSKYYVERLKIGKEGPGIAIKLGINSVYGKLAQSIGEGQFTSWIWAGMITSGCRAQLLQLLGLHKNRNNCLAMATDGIYSREKIELPLPKNTDTNTRITDLSGKTVQKPLGGWETKINKHGLFMIRPGMNFPLKATIDDIEVVRGRGIGRKTLFENIQKIQDAFLAKQPFVQLDNKSVFCGAKTSISRSGKPNNYTYKRAYSIPGYNEVSFGQWIIRPQMQTFDPMPKRSEINSDGTLKLREFPKDLQSMPYPKALNKMAKDTIENINYRKSQEIYEEQPDFEVSEFEENLIDF